MSESSDPRDVAVDAFNYAILIRDEIDRIGTWIPRYNARFMATMCVFGRDSHEKRFLYIAISHETDQKQADKFMMALVRLTHLIVRHTGPVEYRNAARVIVASIIMKRDIDQEGAIKGLMRLFT